jgi:hypothetical protein
MKVIVTCSNDHVIRREVDVYALSFDGASQSFSMPRPIGDDWLQRIRCPFPSAPTSIEFRRGEAAVSFAVAADVMAFADWLVAAEIEAQNGYRTMRG